MNVRIKNMLLILLLTVSLQSYGKGSLIKSMTISADDISSIDQLGLNSREEFDRYDGMFQITIPKQRFSIFQAPKCKKDIMLRMIPLYLSKKGKINKETVEHRWELLQALNSVVEGEIESVTVDLDPEPYARVNNKGEIVLKDCNAFVAEEFWRTLQIKTKTNSTQ